MGSLASSTPAGARCAPNPLRSAGVDQVEIDGYISAPGSAQRTLTAAQWGGGSAGMRESEGQSPASPLPQYSSTTTTTTTSTNNPDHQPPSSDRPPAAPASLA